MRRELQRQLAVAAESGIQFARLSGRSWDDQKRQEGGRLQDALPKLPPGS